MSVVSPVEQKGLYPADRDLLPNSNCALYFCVCCICFLVVVVVFVLAVFVFVVFVVFVFVSAVEQKAYCDLLN